MKSAKEKTEAPLLDGKTETLIAIGAATAANCIPCFEHIYEKAVTSGVTMAEIRRAAELAEKVKNGAHMFLLNTVNELAGPACSGDSACEKTPKQSCCC